MHTPETHSLYADGYIYDCLFADHNPAAEVQFCSGLVNRQGCTLLELACGTGRATVPLAQAGFNVTGIDNAEPMLHRARAKTISAGVSIRLKAADMRSFDLQSRFGVIYLANNSLGHLTTLDDFRSAMSCVRNHLQNDGVFVLDYFNPSMDLLSRPHGTDYAVTSFPDPSAGIVTVTEQVRYDCATQINHVRWRLSSQFSAEQFRSFSMRIYFPAELDALLTLCGLKILAKYGSFTKEPFSHAARQQVIVCANAA